MRAFLIGLALAASPAARAAAQTSCPSSMKCEKLEPAEQQALLGQLRLAQNALKKGEWVPFVLTLGAMASNEMTKVTPREAFLKFDFAKVKTIERVKTEGRILRPHIITYVDGSYSVGPMGRVPFLWDIEVITGPADTIERVNMLYRPPVYF
jgi:hypothetical protein